MPASFGIRSPPTRLNRPTPTARRLVAPRLAVPRRAPSGLPVRAPASLAPYHRLLAVRGPCLTADPRRSPEVGRASGRELGFRGCLLGYLRRECRSVRCQWNVVARRSRQQPVSRRLARRRKPNRPALRPSIGRRRPAQPPSSARPPGPTTAQRRKRHVRGSPSRVRARRGLVTTRSASVRPPRRVRPPSGLLRQQVRPARAPCLPVRAAPTARLPGALGHPVAADHGRTPA